MSKHRYIGGIISATQPTPSQSSASGVWTLDEAEYYQKAGNWPSGSGADPYFQYNALLLHGDGTNGAQNNTFLDSSTNNFTITRNGNTTQGAATPYVGPGNWSTYFNGASGVQWNSANRVTVTSTSTFTMEAWIYLTAAPSSTGPILSDGQVGTATTYWGFELTSTRNLQFFWYTGSVVACISTGTVSLNQWTHVAISVSAGAIKLFIDGVLQSLTGTTTLTNPSGSTVYMQSGMRGSPSNYFTGYISNLRLINNVALYSATFTPSTTPLTATTNTTLLAFGNNNFNDMSASNAGFTGISNTPQVSKFSPFTLYQITPASYSGYFDGSGDYLTLPAGTGLALGTGDFTIEAWVYPTARVTNSAYILSQSSYGVGTDFAFWINSAGILQFYMLTGGANVVSSTGAVSLSAWSHVAISRSGTSFRLFINGVIDGTLTGSQNITNSFVPATIGNSVNNAGSVYFQGSISNLRVVKGQALYTTNFTPSTTPLTTTSQGATAANVFLLTCQNTTFIDNSTNAYAITSYGNAIPKPANPFTDTVSSSPVPYSTTTYGGSGYFDGSGDYLSVADSALLEPGSNNFTVECWFYMTGANATNGSVLFTKAAASSYSPITVGFSPVSAGSSITALSSATGSSWAVNIAGSATATTLKNSWNHVAYVRNGSTFTLYLNGAIAATATSASSLIDNTELVRIGQTNFTATDFPGYISNLRYVVGTAVYTGPFVPPAAPVTAITNTRLLVNATNGGIFDNTTINDLETVGNAQISTTVVKYGTGSIAFDGAGDYLLTDASDVNALAFGSGDFTIEMWVYPTAGTSRMLYDGRPSSAVSLSPTIYINASNVLAYYTNGADRITGASLTLNTWSHIALVRSSGSTKLYINGTQSGSTYADTNVYVNAATRPIIGADGGNVANQNYAGYIDDLRVTKGYARYTANFTPPAAAFPNF